MRKISLFYGHVASNIGDVAINKGVEQLIDAAFPEAAINVVLLNAENSDYLKLAKSSFGLPGKYYFAPFRASGTKIFSYLNDPESFLRDCGAADADLCLINAGEHFFSYNALENAESIFWRALPIYAAKVCGKKAALLPSTYGPFNDDTSRQLMAAMLKVADGFGVREAHSQKVIERQLAMEQPPRLLDPAFFIEPRRNFQSSDRTHGAEKAKVLGLSMRLDTWGIRLARSERKELQRSENGRAEGLAYDASVEVCRAFLTDSTRRVVLFVQTDSDRALVGAVGEELERLGFAGRIEIRKPISIDDYVSQLADVDHVVASRFHALVLAMVAGTPISALYFEQHGHKIPGLFEQLGIDGACVNLSTMPMDEAVAAIMRDLDKPPGPDRVPKAAIEAGKQATLAWLRDLEAAGPSQDPALLTPLATALAVYAGKFQRNATDALAAKARASYEVSRDRAVEEKAKLKEMVRETEAVLLARAKEVARQSERALQAEREKTRAAEAERAQVQAERARIEAERSRVEQKRRLLETELVETLKRSKAEAAAARAAGKAEITHLLAYRLGTVITAHIKRPWTWPIVPLRMYQAFRTFRADQANADTAKPKADAAKKKIAPAASTPAKIETPTERPAYDRLQILGALIPEKRPPEFDLVKNRICYILHNSLPYSSGGYAARAHGLAGGLTQLGFDVICLTRPGFPLDTVENLAAEDIPESAQVDAVTYVRTMKPARKGGFKIGYIKESIDAMETQFRKYKPAIVIAASNYFTGLPAMIAARRLGIPFVYEVRGFWEITRLSREPEYAEDATFKNGRRTEALVCNSAEHTFTLTEAMREELADRGVDAGRVSLLPNSCDIDRYQPMERYAELAAALNIPAHVAVIGYIGTFADYEGLDDLAAACALVKQQGREFRLLLVGNEDVSNDKPGVITQSIRESAERGDYVDWLIMPGRVPHEMVRKYYSLIDIAPFSRKPWPVCEMVSPMKPLEAMAMEKAVLVSSVRALSEMVQHEETGLVYEKGNNASLADALMRLIDEPALRARVGGQSRIWVSENRTWKATAKKAATKIETIMSAKFRVPEKRNARYLGRDFDATLDLIEPPKRPLITPRPKRLCYVLHNTLPYSSGGYATRGHGLARGLVDGGYDVVALSRSGFPLDIDDALKAEDIPASETIDGVTYVRDLELHRGRTALADYVRASADILERQFLELRPSCVMSASFAQWTGLPALIAARRVGLPFVYEVRGLAEITRMSRNPRFSDSAKFDEMEALEAAVCDRADHVFTLTGPMRDLIAQRGAPLDKITLIANSCNIDRFTPMAKDHALGEQLGIPADVPVIGYVGTFIDYEGLDDLAQACALLKASGRKFRLLMVGNEGLSLSNRWPITNGIREGADKGGYANWLIMPGRVPHDTVRGYYSLIDIAPFPRKPWPVCEMVSPMKPLEAMAMEKAVIVSSAQALAEMVQHEQTGLVYTKGDNQSLADALARLIDDADLRARLGRNARQWVGAHRTWKHTAERAIEVIDAVVARHADLAAPEREIERTSIA